MPSADFPLLDFDETAAEQSERLRQRYHRLGTNDLRVAAIALTAGAVLVTRNTIHFAKIGGLPLEDWSEE
ncbi:MAG: type II toxin-antitoxin system VapC family toxin [Chloroflexi bacterium]|nr:type II toxin-antitoxin system VapC family toxin [Chloroflexota bacterium]